MMFKVVQSVYCDAIQFNKNSDTMKDSLLRIRITVELKEQKWIDGLLTQETAHKIMMLANLLNKRDCYKSNGQRIKLTTSS